MKRYDPLFCCLLTLNGCAFMKKFEPQLVSCEGSFAQQVPSLLPQVFLALQEPAAWAQALDALLEAEGPAAACAVDEAIADLESKVGGVLPSSADLGSPQMLQLIRAHAWQQAHGHRTSGLGYHPWVVRT